MKFNPTSEKDLNNNTSINLLSSMKQQRNNLMPGNQEIDI